MRKIIIICLIFILTSCGGQSSQSPENLLSATETNTLEPSITPTPNNTPTATATTAPTATITPTPTPKASVIDKDPADLLLTKADLPEDLRYYIPPSKELPREKPYRIPPSGSSPKKNPAHVAYMWTNQADADEYLNSTGRISGYEVIYYRKGNPESDYPAEIWDNVSLFNTSDGAELAVDIWADRMLFIHQNNHMVFEVKHTTVGDYSRLITNTFQQYRVTIINGEPFTDYRRFETRREYLLMFSVHNVTHYLYFYGREGQLDSYIVEKIGKLLANKMYAIDLSEAVTFEPK